MLTAKVAVVGGGPVGLLAVLLLEKFGIDYVCFERS
jgi:2-polyprenyl-6-methoxyphenol hydroxylase-like FAD-dependent oxidoreductase